MNERTTVEIRATLDVLKPIVHDLRERGYDANAWVEHRGDGRYTVEIRIAVPPVGVPTSDGIRVDPDEPSDGRDLRGGILP